MRLFFAHALFFLAAWTVVIKYLFPLAWALHEGVPAGTYVFADLWPVVHVWLGYSLMHWRRWTFPAAAVIAAAEIAIVSAKFAVFLSAPEWTIWRTNWFINKIFVLACFVLLFGWLLRHAGSAVFRRTGSAAG
jgi:hypothetical protein